MQARRIHLNGIVQGVGFRPHVARTARALGCTGWVRNDTHGVDIHVQHADDAALDAFERALVEDAPAASRILDLESRRAETEDLDGFSIIASSHDEGKSTLISPDLATCDECVAELFDPEDRRYRYPFVNCTNCGPRFTIIEDLPYDRPATSMRGFAMDAPCVSEYEDDKDRRYHAQPNACFDCGPRLWWEDDPRRCSFTGEGALSLDCAHLAREQSDAIIAHACERLRAGDILAIKGLGGWHLACDATNGEAVARLRERKRRPSKPLAVMVRDLDMAREHTTVSEAEAEMLSCMSRPITLLERREGTGIATEVAGGLPELGLMLPATPLQHLLMHELDIPLVMTSGNRSGEPIVARDDDALDVLAAIADGFLGNNRAIVARYDDSVVRVLPTGRVQMIRRARGYAPTPLLLAPTPVPTREHPVIFAAGPEQKANFAILDGDRVYVSQHLGDLENLGAWKAYEEARERYGRLFDARPQLLACDMHPEYLASKWAREAASELDLPLVEVQHHHAHIASVLGENALEDPVIGVALDGTGYGTDGTIWGGEILVASRADFERFWHLPAFRLPGGSAAILDPDRIAYALLRAYGELDDEFFGQYSLDNPQFAGFLEDLANRELLDQMIDRNINSPVCTSAGRLFDGTSALLGTCRKPGYDGEAACLLEAAAWREVPGRAPLTARTFHEGLINAIIEQVSRARRATGIDRIALGGGCMVNRLVLTWLWRRLEGLGFEVFANRELPPNDGCIAYGQAVVARARLEE